MSDELLNDRIRAALPGIPDDTILHARKNWFPENFIRRMLTAENERKINEARRSLETCADSEMKELQGRIKGLKDANANINAIQL